MKYIEFRQKFTIPIFTSQDIRLLRADITPSQLTNWQKKGYLTKIRGGVYLFNDSKNEISAEEIGAVLVEPSYISLESALFRYHLITEVVFATTSVTPKLNREYKTKTNFFIYQHLKSELFFGYEKQPGKFRPYFIAEPEKAILDFFYLHPNIKNELDIKELRLNLDTFQKLDQNKIDAYMHIFPIRIQKLIKITRKLNA